MSGEDDTIGVTFDPRLSQIQKQFGFQFFGSHTKIVRGIVVLVLDCILLREVSIFRDVMQHELRGELGALEAAVLKRLLRFLRLDLERVKRETTCFTLGPGLTVT